MLFRTVRPLLACGDSNLYHRRTDGRAGRHAPRLLTRQGTMTVSTIMTGAGRAVGSTAAASHQRKIYLYNIHRRKYLSGEACRDYQRLYAVTNLLFVLATTVLPVPVRASAVSPASRASSPSRGQGPSTRIDVIPDQQRAGCASPRPGTHILSLVTVAR